MPEEEQLRVSSSTSCQKLGGALAGIISKGRTPTMVCIGAGAINQAVKAMIIARRMSSISGYDLVFVPAFVTLNLSEEGGKEDVTAVMFKVLTR